MSARCARCSHPVQSAHRPRRAGVRALKGRGLCSACRQAGERGVFDLASFPPVLRPRKVVLDTWSDLSAMGVSDGEIAARLDMTVDALTLALRRARLAGDVRAEGARCA